MGTPVRGLSKLLAVSLLCILSGCMQRNNAINEVYNSQEHEIVTRRGRTSIGKQPVTGLVITLNGKGDTLSSIPFLNGRENGVSRIFHENGKLKEVRFLINGWKEGEHTGWFENGQLQFRYHFKNDMFEGNQKEWLSNGQLYSDLNYVKGMEYGSQRVWYPNGKIKTNYVIRNDRRYGLLGTKNCVNAVDSVFDSN